MSAGPTSDELVSLFQEGMLANAIASRFELSQPSEIEAVEAQCIALHNAGIIDLLRLIDSNAIQDLAAHKFFLASHFFCRILPHLETTPARMMACVESLVSRGGEDLAANQPNSALRDWFARVPHRAKAVISAAINGDDLASRNLTFALEAIGDVGRAREIALTCNDRRCLASVTALSRIADEDPASCAETLVVLGTLLDRGADDEFRATLLLTTMTIAARSHAGLWNDAILLVRRLVSNAEDRTLHCAAHVLWAHRKALRQEIVETLLEALERLNPQNKGTVSELDIGLKAALDIGHEEAVISFVTKMLSAPDNQIELKEFDSFSASLLSGPSERLSRVVVRWLLIGAPDLCQGLVDALQGNDLNGPVLDLRPEDLAISPEAQLFICRKSIGWFFLKPTTASSILVSVLRTCDPTTAIAVQRLLVEQILTNYHGVRQYLDSLASTDSAKSRVKQALALNDRYLKALRSLPVIKELHPSELHRRISQFRMSDYMRGVSREADSKSVFHGLVKRSVILYGKSSLTYIKDQANTLHPREMDLKPYGISFEMPRMEAIDPVGIDYILRVYRAERLAL